MKNFFQRLFSANPGTANPPQPDLPAPSSQDQPLISFHPPVLSEEERTAAEVRRLLERLNYVHREPATQLRARLEAIQQLRLLGAGAEAAIPALLRKTFTEDPQESQAALQALEDIHAAWQRHERALGEIPFLIGKLKSEQRIANKAIRLLIGMGDPAVPPLLEKLYDPTLQDDEYLTAQILQVLAKTRTDPDVLRPAITRILAHSRNDFLLGAAEDAVCQLGIADETTVQHLIRLLDSKNHQLRARAIQALRVGGESVELAIVPIMNCLADDYKDVRDKAIEALSAHDSPMAMEFYRKVVENKGELKEAELESLFGKLKFWVTGSDLEDFRLNRARFWDNLSWYALELNQRSLKPAILLESVLTILNNRRQTPAGMAPELMKIMQQAEPASLKCCCVHILGNMTEGKEAIVPFLIDHLADSSEKVRNACVVSLHTLDPEWTARPETVRLIERLIEDFDSADKGPALEALSSLGELSVPMLSDYLDKTEKRVIQETILEALDKFSSHAQGILPVLLRFKKRCTNTQTLMALNELIRKVEER